MPFPKKLAAPALAVSLSSVLLAAACKKAAPSGDGPSSGGTSAAKAAVLEAAGACAVKTYQRFVDASTALGNAASAYDAAPADEAARTAAQNAWKAAFDAWQEAELFQVGPAAMTGSPGGQDQRDGIYSWPLVSRCNVEQNLVSKAYEEADFATKALVNVKGLAALEYLLFYLGTDNTCGPSAAINTSGGWAALDGAELARRKARYAKVVAADVAARAAALVAAWQPEGGNFKDALATAGRGSKVFSTDQMALNALSDALFYIESEAKDMKVGRPLGVAACAEPPCSTEAPYSPRSKEAVARNVEGFKRVFVGCGDAYAGPGFDDLLEGIGATQLAAEMKGHLDGIDAALAGLGDRTLEDALANDPASVRKVYDALKALTDDLRTQFIGVLDLELPKRVEGDND